MYTLLKQIKKEYSQVISSVSKREQGEGEGMFDKQAGMDTKLKVQDP